MSSAFVPSAAVPLTSSFAAPCRGLSPRTLRVSLRRASRTVRMSDQQQQEATPSSTPVDVEQTPAAEGFSAPSLNTTVFSDFVESLQERIEVTVTRVRDIDSDKLVADSIDAGKGLADNLLAGDWLNRGELYGALQLSLVVLLFRSLPGIDALVTLLTGPALIAAGAGVSGKALWDLGLKNLSIWPAPVPGGTLKTEGLYAQVRHPIYSGLLVASVGYAVSTASPAKLAIAAALAVLIAKKIDVEESFLADIYPDYDEYKETVPYKLLPKLY